METTRTRHRSCREWAALSQPKNPRDKPSALFVNPGTQANVNSTAGKLAWSLRRASTKQSSVPKTQQASCKCPVYFITLSLGGFCDSNKSVFRNAAPAEVGGMADIQSRQSVYLQRLGHPSDGICTVHVPSPTSVGQSNSHKNPSDISGIQLCSCTQSKCRRYRYG
jgi:hypothetical protein